MRVLNSLSARGQPWRRCRAASVAGALVLLSAGCNGGSRADLPPASVDQRRGVVEKEGTPTTPQRAPSTEAPAGSGEVPPQLLSLFQDDLAQRALVKPETITVVSATEQQWPNGGLGCPEPGQMYMQIVIPGYRVLLKAGSETYDYHSDTRGNFVVCAGGRSLQPVKQQMKTPSPAE